MPFSLNLLHNKGVGIVFFFFIKAIAASGNAYNPYYACI